MATITVSQDGSANYTTVKDAIINASSGDKIDIDDDNTYTETWNALTIPASLTIKYSGVDVPYPTLRINWNANTLDTMNDVTFYKLKMDWQDITTDAVIQYNAKKVVFDRCYMYNVTELVNADCQSGAGKFFYNCILDCDSIFNAASNFDSNDLLFRNCSIRYSSAFVTGDFFASHDADEPYIENCIISKSGDNITKSNFAPDMLNTNYNVFSPRFEYCVFTGDPQTVNALLGTGCTINKTESEIYLVTTFAADVDYRIKDVTFLVNSGVTDPTTEVDYNGNSRAGGNDIGAWEYEQIGTPPALTGVDPYRVDRGDRVTLTGTDLTSDGTLEIYSASLAYTFISSTEISFVEPGESHGDGGSEGYPEPAIFSNQYGNDSHTFHLNAIPKITDKSKDAVFLDEEIIIYGEDFEIFPYVDFVSIEFDGVAQISDSVNETTEGTDNIVVPSVSGVAKNTFVDVTVTTEDGSDTKLNFFRIKALPVVNSISDSQIYKDELLTINGNYFENLEPGDSFPDIILFDYGNHEDDYIQNLTDDTIDLSFPEDVTENKTYQIRVSNRDGLAENTPDLYIKVLPKFLSYSQTLIDVGVIYNYGIIIEGEFPEALEVTAELKPDWLELEKIDTYNYELKGIAVTPGVYDISLRVSNEERESIYNYSLVVQDKDEQIAKSTLIEKQDYENLRAMYIRD